MILDRIEAWLQRRRQQAAFRELEADRARRIAAMNNPQSIASRKGWDTRRGRA